MRIDYIGFSFEGVPTVQVDYCMNYVLFTEGMEHLEEETTDFGIETDNPICDGLCLAITDVRNMDRWLFAINEEEGSIEFVCKEPNTWKVRTYPLNREEAYILKKCKGIRDKRK